MKINSFEELNEYVKNLNEVFYSMYDEIEVKSIKDLEPDENITDSIWFLYVNHFNNNDKIEIIRRQDKHYAFHYEVFSHMNFKTYHFTIPLMDKLDSDFSLCLVRLFHDLYDFDIPDIYLPAYDLAPGVFIYTDASLSFDKGVCLLWEYYSNRGFKALYQNCSDLLFVANDEIVKLAL